MSQRQKNKKSDMASANTEDKSQGNDNVNIGQPLTIGKLISSFSGAQIWAILTACFLVIGGAFGLGYKLKSDLAQAEIAQTKLEGEKLKDKISEMQKYYQGTDIKEQFLTLYTRFLNAKETADGVPTNEDLQEERELAAKHMATFLNEQLTQAKSDKGSTDFKSPAIKVGRGVTPEQSTIVFSGDNTAWVLPREVVKHVNPTLLTNDGISGKPNINTNTSRPRKANPSKLPDKNSAESKPKAKN